MTTKKQKEALSYAQLWLSNIKDKKHPSKKLATWMQDESVHNFEEYFNKGWIENRKSITEAEDGHAVTEWKGLGGSFQDIQGNIYIDFLGGYGMMSHGWSHPDVVTAVKAQLDRTPMPSQELLDPLRGVLARIMADILP
jgi:putrescine aminotransferase